MSCSTTQASAGPGRFAVLTPGRVGIVLVAAGLLVARGAAAARICEPRCPVGSTPAPGSVLEAVPLGGFIYAKEECETRAGDLTTCSFTIAESPGRFELACDNAERTTSGDDLGRLLLEADCDVVVR